LNEELSEILKVVRSLDLQAVQSMVQQAMQYIDQTLDIETRIELIKTLNNVAAGKVRIRVGYCCCCCSYICLNLDHSVQVFFLMNMCV
jgi:hypothetical protein